MIQDIPQPGVSPIQIRESWDAVFSPVYAEPRIPPAIAKLCGGDHQRIAGYLSGEHGWAYARNRCIESYRRLSVSMAVQQCWNRQEGIK